MTRLVLKLGGRIAEAGAAEALTLRAAGHDVVVVHGAGPQITAEMERRGIEPSFVAGRRVTTAEVLEVVRESLAEVNAAVCAAIGPDAVPLFGDAIGLRADHVKALGLVGIDVQRPGSKRSNDRNQPGCQRLLDGRRGRWRRVADKPESLDLLGAKPDCVAEERHCIGADRSTDRGVHLREGLAHDLQNLSGRHPATGDERRLDPAPLHLGGDLRTGTVDDDDIVALSPQRERLGSSGLCDPTAQFEHEPGHVV